MSDEQTPVWAVEKAIALLNAGTAGLDTTAWFKSDWSDPETGLPQFARYIAEHEEAPVDPLLLEARKMAADLAREIGNYWADPIERGEKDAEAQSGVRLALAALRRGMELATQPTDQVQP